MKRKERDKLAPGTGMSKLIPRRHENNCSDDKRSVHFQAPNGVERILHLMYNYFQVLLGKLYIDRQGLWTDRRERKSGIKSDPNF